MDMLQKISEELQKGNYQEVPKLVQQALDAKIPPAKILSDGLVAGMDIVGDKFRRDELFMPEVLISAKAMQAGMDDPASEADRSRCKACRKDRRGNGQGRPP